MYAIRSYYDTTASTTFSVYSVDAAGTKLGVVTGATYTITNASGTNVTATYATGTISAAGVGTINTLTKAVGELPAGTYTIKVTVGTANYVYGTLTVTSTRPRITSYNVCYTKLLRSLSPDRRC